MCQGSFVSPLMVWLGLLLNLLLVRECLEEFCACFEMFLFAVMFGGFFVVFDGAFVFGVLLDQVFSVF